MLKEFRADLHIHTCLSPCADIEMSPLAIVKEAVHKGIDIIAITDHNSAENVIASQKAAYDSTVKVLAGMEITSSEEAHILALFENAESVLKLQGSIYENLLPGENDEKHFGEQIVVNENDEVSGFNNRLLIAATTIDSLSLVEMIHSLGGLAVASHVDKGTFSIISQLGFIPDDLRFDALEMSPHIDREQSGQKFREYSAIAWLSSSDAHYIRDIGKRTTSFFMNSPTLADMALALKKADGRRVEWK
jgi:PHP family Zn ribbon phosphoesterase